MRIDIEHWYYTTDEDNRFHSVGEEPAIVVYDYVDDNNEAVHWYKARYEHWKLLRSERDTGEEFISNE